MDLEQQLFGIIDQVNKALLLLQKKNEEITYAGVKVYEATLDQKNSLDSVISGIISDIQAASMALTGGK